MSSTLDDFVSKVLKNRQTSLYIMYGSTEAGMLIMHQLRPEDGRFKTGVCGKALPGVEIKVRQNNIVGKIVLEK